MEFTVNNLTEGNLAPSIETPYAELNEQIGGWVDGKLSIVSGAVGQGKTLFAIESALVAMQADKLVLFLSIENTREQILDRMVNLLLDEESLWSEEDALSFIEASGLQIEAGFNMGTEQIRRITKEHAQEEGIDFIIVDTMQITPEDEEGLYEAIVRVNHKMSQLAKGMEVPILMMVQKTARVNSSSLDEVRTTSSAYVSVSIDKE